MNVHRLAQRCRTAGSPRTSCTSCACCARPGCRSARRKVIDALAAVEAVGLDQPRATFARRWPRCSSSRHEQLAIFEQAFDLFWRNPKLLERDARGAAAARRRPRGDDAATAESAGAPRAGDAAAASRRSPPRDDDDEITLDAAFTFSPREVLQAKDFETMTADEWRRCEAMLARLRLPLPRMPTRRTHAVAARPPRRPARDAARA